MKNTFILSIIICLTVACKDKYSTEVERALRLADSNRIELEKVIDHYSQNRADHLKLKAACFLIENMEYHYSYEGALVNDYRRIFNYADSLVSSDIKYIPWDSLERVHKKSRRNSITPVSDLHNVTSNYLIKNIESAFSMWRKPWANHLSFQEFCEFILPYRLADEPLNDWREFAISRFGSSLVFPDSNIEYTTKEACVLVNEELINNYQISSSSLVRCPYSLDAKSIFMQKTGVCLDAAMLTTSVMRGLGVPVAIDFTPYWANRSLGHSWNVVHYESRLVSFMGTESNPGLTKLEYTSETGVRQKIAKVYRKTFAKQTTTLDLIRECEKDVPPLFSNIHFIDVTKEYMPVTEVKIHLKDKYEDKKYAYLCVFNNKNWKAIHYGKIEEKKVTFTDMGRRIAYLPMYFIRGNYIPAGDPVIVDSKGGIHFLVANVKQRQSVTLTKKYPVDDSNKVEIGDMYELFYWRNGWNSLGEQLATSNYLIFDDVPKDGLYLLRDITKGKQERIFTYENNKQIWW